MFLRKRKNHQSPSQKKLRRLYILAITLPLLFVLIPVVYFSLNRASETSAAWFDGSFGYRKMIPITNTSGTAQTDFQTELSLDTATQVTSGKLQSDCDDIRFTDTSGKVLSYWIEPNTCNTAATKVFVKVPSIPTSGADIYWYYGNPTASTASQADQTFVQEMDAAAAAWPLDDTTSTQSYARSVHPADTEGRNLVQDSTMEISGTTSWTATNGAALTKETVTQHDGSTGSVLRITSTGTAGPRASQASLMVTGKTYRITFWARGDGTLGGQANDTSNMIAGTSITSSTSWQYFDITFKATNTTLAFQASTASGSFIEIDDATLSLVNIPSSQTTATNLLTDGTMETAGTAAWTVYQGATLTKETTSPYAGTQVLKVARNSTNNPGANQTVLTVGSIYRVYGYTRSDGNAQPRIRDTDTAHWTGTTSTSWQPFDFVFVATTTELTLQAVTSTGTQYVEFDNVTVSVDTSVRLGELLQDGDTEAAGTGNWIAASSATITKQTTSPHGGTQVLRVAHNGVATPRAAQNIMIIGKKYRIQGYGRGDATATLNIYDTNTLVYTGTSSTSWQFFDFIITATSADIRFGSSTNTSSTYVEYDDISVTEVSPMVGLPTNGVTLGSSSGTGGHGATAYSFDGTNDVVNAYSSDLNGAFNPNEGTLVVWAKVSGSGVWTDGSTRNIAKIAVDNNNRIELYKRSSNNQIAALYAAGGTTINPQITFSSTGWFQLVMTWSKSNNSAKFYINAAQQDSATGLGTWTGNLTSTTAAIGSSTSGGATPWSGLINDVRLYTRALSDTEIAAQYSASVDVSAYTTSNYPGKELFRKYDIRVSTGTLASEEITPGPIAEWKFDEGQGQTAQDSTSNNIDGTLGLTSGSSTDDPSWLSEDQCVSGKCLRFGGGDMVDVGMNPATGTSDFTLSAWIRTKQTTEGHIISRGYAGNANSAMLRINAGLLLFKVSNATELVSTQTIGDNQWHHVAGSADRDGNAVLYIDGKVAGSGSISSASANDINLATGWALGVQDGTGGDGDYIGDMDDAKIYKYARSEAQIKADYNTGASKLGSTNQAYLSNGLVGYWKMDETSGTTVADSSGNGNTGTLTNAQETGTADASGGSTTVLVDTDGTLSSTDDAYNGMILRVTSTCGAIAANTDRLISDYTGSTKTFTVSTAFAATLNSCAYQILHQTGGKFGNGVAFDGSNDSINIYSSNFASQFNGTEGTVSMWVKIASSGTWTDDTLRRAIYIAVNDNNRIVMQKRNTDNSMSWHYIAGGTDTQVIKTSISDTGWIQVAITWNKTKDEVRAFFNGKQEGATQTGLGTFSGSLASAETQIGAESAGIRIWSGGIDETRVYNRALSPAEITDLYSFASGPVGHWKMDDAIWNGTTGEVIDSSGNANNGVSVSGVTITQGKFGNGALFAGNNYINVGNGSSLEITGAISVSAWINVSSHNSNYRMIARRPTSESTFWFLHLNSSNQISFSSSGAGAEYNDGYAYPADSLWHYVTGTFDGTTIRIYLDGLLVDSYAGAPLRSGGSNNLLLGSNGGTWQYFTGKMDDVKLYNYARSPSQIIEDMNGEHPLGGSPIGSQVAYWALDEQQGTTVNNTTPTIFTEAITGAAWKTKTNCKINGCLDFDGSDDVLTITNANAIDFDTNLVSGFTFSSWIYADSDGEGDTGQIFYKGTNTWCRVDSESGGNLDVQCSLDLTTTDATLNVATPLTTGTWNHFAVSYTDDADDEITIWINGKPREISTDGSGTPAITDTANLLIGGTTTANFDGKIDEFKIYSSELTQEQIAIDFNANSSITYGATATSESTQLADGAGNPPIGEWNFDEKPSSTAIDTSGNGNNGTLVCITYCPIPTTGKVGAALNFVPSASITIGDISSFDFGASSDFSISAWINSADIASQDQVIVSKQNGINTTLGYVLFVENSTSSLRAIVSDGTNSIQLAGASNSLTLNTWTHVLLVWDDDTGAYLYKNGQLLTSSTSISSVGSLSSTLNLKIGATHTGASSFNGKEDQIKIWDYALTPSQVAYDFNRGLPLAQWQIDECEGATINDASGNSLSGTLTIGASGTQTAAGTCTTSSTAWGNGVTGKYNASLNFDGTDDYVSFGNPASLRTFSQMTISAWVNGSNFPSGDTDIIVYKDTSGYYLGVFDRKLRFRSSDLTSDSTDGSTTLSNSTWYHVAMTWDGATVKLYLNGKLDGSEAGTGTISEVTLNVALGAFNGSSLFFGGKMDDVRIYNYALSESQLRKVMNDNSSVRYGPNTGSP